MFKSIEYLSLDAIKKRKPTLDTVVISILDQEEAIKRPRLGGWRSTLALTFEDTSEELKHSSVVWPDNPTIEEHAKFSQVRGNTVPALIDVEKIHSFLMAHGTSAEQLHLVVHCYGGVSRSAAVAQWASVRFFVPLEREPGYPNARVLRLLDKAEQLVRA